MYIYCICAFICSKQIKEILKVKLTLRTNQLMTEIGCDFPSVCDLESVTIYISINYLS